MKKRIGLTALLLLALVVGLVPQSAYAQSNTSVRKAYTYTESGRKHTGAFCILFKCDDQGTSMPEYFDGMKVYVNDNELREVGASSTMSGNQFIRAYYRMKYEEDDVKYSDPYIFISKDAIKADAKIKIEIPGLEPMHLVVKGTEGNYTAEPYDPTQTQDPGEAAADPEEAKKALEKAKEYLDSVDEDALALVQTDENASAIQAYRNALRELKEIVDKKEQGQTLDELDIVTIQDLLGHQENGDWNLKKSEIRKLARNIVLDFKVVGERTEQDKNFPVKKYTTVDATNGVIKIKTGIKGLSVNSETKKLYLNAITKEVYENKDVDASTGPTPKYKKVTFPKENYKITEEADGYTITVKNVPEKFAFLKPVAKVQIAKDTNAENGDPVFVKRAETPSHPSYPSTPSVPSVTTPSGEMTKIPAQEGEAHGYALAPAGSVDANTRVRITEKANGKQDVILVDANGNQVYSDELMLVTIPAPKGQQGSYRVKVDGVYTTFELSEDGKYVTMPMVFSRDGKRTEDVVVTEGAVTVKGTKTALPGMYQLSVTDRGNARYSVNLFDTNGNKAHSNGPVMVSMPAPAGAGDVYRVNADGKWITFEVENKTVRFALVF